jgi:hypothetical protein
MNELALWAKSQPNLKLIGVQLIGTEFWYVLCRGNFRKKTIEGFGVDIVKNLASTKAIAEWVERCTASSLGTSSCGFAAHSVAKNAILGASKELIERDAFFCHWLTYTPGNNIETSQTKRWAAFFKNLNFGLKYSQLQSSDSSLAIVLCLVQFSENSASFGLGCESTLEEAIEKSTLEVLPTAIQQSKNIQPQESFLSEGENLNSAFHHNLALNNFSLEQTAFLFGQQKIENTDNIYSIETSLIELPPELKECPLVVAQAKCGQLQKHFFGPTVEENLNKQRLVDFVGNQNFQLNFKTHYLG